jgi:hypothetical protein
MSPFGILWRGHAVEGRAAVEPGEGDSVEKYAQLWGGMTLEAVHDEILKARERGELTP